MALLFASPARAVEIDCLSEPWRSITLSAAIEGVVEEVNVDRGDTVEANQVVARLESSVERASVEVARLRAQAQGDLLARQARLDFAGNSLERQKNLAKRDIVSQSDMDEAVSGKQVAEAELRAAREAQREAALELRRSQSILDRRTIRSPIAGVVIERILSPGEYADPPQIMRIAQIDPLRVEAFAPFRLFGRIQPGMEAEVFPEAPLGGRHRAKVTVADRVLDAASGTFRVRLELPNPEGALPAGFNCRVRFPIDEDALEAAADPLPTEEVETAEHVALLEDGAPVDGGASFGSAADTASDDFPLPLLGPGPDGSGAVGFDAYAADAAPWDRASILDELVFSGEGARPKAEIAPEPALARESVVASLSEPLADPDASLPEPLEPAPSDEAPAPDPLSADPVPDQDLDPLPADPDATSAEGADPNLGQVDPLADAFEPTSPSEPLAATESPPATVSEDADGETRAWGASDLEARFWDLAERAGCERGSGLLSLVPLAWVLRKRQS